MSLYHLRNVSVTYGNRTVLDLPELTIEPGRIIGLLGPNGAGKTTLLRILSFLEAPTQGAVFFDGRPVSWERTALPALRRRIVLVPQSPILFTTTVYKNIEYGLKIRKVPQPERRRVVEDLLELTGLAHLAHQPGHKLSGGETQRAAIARALACRPRGVLFDEPTANVDLENRVVIEDLIRRINREDGLSVILTTHNLLQAGKLTDRVLHLYDGRLTADVYDNLFTGRIEGGRLHLLGGKIDLPSPFEPRENGLVRVAVYPQYLQVKPLDQAPLADGQIAGRLIQSSIQGDQVRLVVDVGAPLSVILPLKDYGGLAAGLGDPVRVYCPGRALALI